MTNFERYIDELTQDKFIDSMILVSLRCLN